MCTMLQDLVSVVRALSRNTAPMTISKYIISWENKFANLKSLVLLLFLLTMIGKAREIQIQKEE